MTERSGSIIVLVKPQFEAGREQVGKRGIVRDPVVQAAAVDKVRQCLIAQGCARIDEIESPILGGEGNREFLLYGEFSDNFCVGNRRWSFAAHDDQSPFSVQFPFNMATDQVCRNNFKTWQSGTGGNRPGLARMVS